MRLLVEWIRQRFDIRVEMVVIDPGAITVFGELGEVLDRHLCEFGRFAERESLWCKLFERAFTSPLIKPL